jgi:hypothetical protein
VSIMAIAKMPSRCSWGGGERPQSLKRFSEKGSGTTFHDVGSVDDISERFVEGS